MAKQSKALQLVMDSERRRERSRTIEAYSVIALLVLRDKFEFESDKIQQFVAEINEHFDAMFKGYFNLNDAKKALEDEGLDINFKGGK